ncbi:MAG: hypothetical protein JF603_01060 [Acidobacteria bacterium]|nr:hypothetical protein [Acidobacteriota bacterium]
MDSPAGTARLIGLTEAARVVALDEAAVDVLARAGYLRVAAPGPLFAVDDVKALLARLSDLADDALAEPGPTAIEIDSLVEAIDARAEEMARRGVGMFRSAFPDVTRWWTSAEEARFVEQSRERLQAILAITGRSDTGDVGVELEEVGADAAWTGSSLTQLLVVLRISRDLLVRTAVEVAAPQARAPGPALSALLTRILPAMDKLTDAVARGYWEAVIAQDEGTKGRWPPR